MAHVLDLVLILCRAASWVLAAAHLVLSRLGAARRSAVIPSSLTALRACWLARCVREAIPGLLATPLRRELLARVCFVAPPIAGGYLVATCHSPWVRLLSAWCRERDALVFAASSWQPHLDGRLVTGGTHDLLRLVRHLRRGGLAFIMVDVFPLGRGCALRFLGHDRNATLVPARIASLAGVPIVPMVARFTGRRIEFATSPALHVGAAPGDVHDATRAVLAVVESAIQREPAVWNGALSGALHPRLRAQRASGAQVRNPANGSERAAV